MSQPLHNGVAPAPEERGSLWRGRVRHVARKGPGYSVNCEESASGVMRATIAWVKTFLAG